MSLKISRSWAKVTEQDCPHLLFYGPSGSGKKTLIMALLRQMFGPSADKVKVENKTWKIDAGTRTIDLELTTLSSTHHVELNPGDAGFQDRYIVQEIIKEMTKNRPIDTKGKKGFRDFKKELRSLNRELQLHLLELAEVLVERPSQYARRVEDISLIFKNLHHLLNSLRPHQARATLIHILELHIQRRKQAVVDIERRREEAQRLLKEALGTLEGQ